MKQGGIESTTTTTENNKQTIYIETFAGSISGALTRFFIAPLDVVKIRLQLQKTTPTPTATTTATIINNNVKYRGVIQSLYTIFKEEGGKALWKGNLSAELLWISYTAVQFTAYNHIVSLLDKDFYLPRSKGEHYKPSLSISLLSGGLSGMISTIVTYPFDIMRTNIIKNHQQVTLLSTYRSIIKDGGHIHLYKGLSSSLLQIVPQMSLQFAFYESFKHFIIGKSDNIAITQSNPLNQFFCGALSGALSKFFVLPFDVTKKRLQVHQYGYGFRNCIKEMYRNEGLSCFFKGGVPSILKAGLASAFSFMFFEQWKSYFIHVLNK
ncbi:hypothetical protein CYY_000434 [Polysphondylium violaceum]|uniref:Mitochondrial substrate carrier family protein n=1 Tax=Polysphondylium violaceum TaxID=133409 RepID=A0A8J4Q3M1_9MYCE|nr:hypothetical protein CYY_000434 [Polysphondylium violaceum]